jgi:DNA invertase Pin-like site-specific DNA recombinase
MVIGYARVSTDGQDESLQIDALKAAGCERIYVDLASGAIRERPELINALRDLSGRRSSQVCWLDTRSGY